jgi:hypothetical protein
VKLATFTIFRRPFSWYLCNGNSELFGDSTSQLEMLDEVEELNLVLQHYAITWGVKLPDIADGSKSKAKWVDWEMRASTVNEDEEDGGI